MQMSDENDDGGRSRVCDEGVEEGDLGELERVCCGCGIVTFVVGSVMVRAIEGRLPGAGERKRRVVETYGVVFLMMCFVMKRCCCF